MIGLGTITNVSAIVLGSALGVFLNARFPARLRTTLMDGLGLLTVAVGISGFLDTTNPLFPLISIVIGGTIGELLHIERRLEGLGEHLHRRAERMRLGHPRFVEGFVTASLTYCVGAMIVVGSINEGITGDPRNSGHQIRP